MTRVVLITGSTDGIGRQAARQLAANGMYVIVHMGIPVEVLAAEDARTALELRAGAGA